jgi:alpha-glucosidase
MQWDDSENAGFSKGTPWLPVPATSKTHNVADESKNPDSVLEFYQSVLKLRHSNPALLDGSYKAINDADANVLSYLRLDGDRAMVVALNMSDAPRKVTVDLKGNGFASVRALLASEKPAAHGDEILLPPFAVFIGELSK